MKQITTLFLALTLLFQTVYSQTSPLIKYLPDDASMIMSFNPLKLANKIPGDVFRQSFIYQSIAKEKKTDAMNFLSDFSSTGIDLSQDMMMVMTFDPSQKNPMPSMQIFGVLKNEPAFASTINKFASGKDSLHQYGLDKILFFNNGKATLAWNNEIFVINGPDKKMETEMKNDLKSDSSSEKDSEKQMSEMKEKIYRTQREKCFDLLTPRFSNRMNNNQQFTDLINKPGDIKMWTNGSANAFMQNGKNPLAGFLSKYKSFLGNNTTGIINFENGKITAESQTWLSESANDIYKKYPTAEFSAELNKHLPKGKILLMMNFSYNPDILKEIVHQTGIDAMAGSLKTMMPFNPKDFHQVFKNNLLLTIMKPDKIDEADSMTKRLGGLQIFLAMPVADKEKFLELKSSVSGFMDSLKKSGKGGDIFKGFNPSARYNDNLFVLSISPDAASAFLNNNNDVPDWLQSNTKYPVAMSIDMKEIFTLAASKKNKTPEEAKKIIGMFDQMIIYSGHYENGSLNGRVEFRFTNQADNAFKQLFDLINMAAEEKGKTKK